MEPQRTQRKTLCPQERRSKGRDIAGWEIDSWVEGEAVLGGSRDSSLRGHRGGGEFLGFRMKTRLPIAKLS